MTEDVFDTVKVLNCKISIKSKEVTFLLDGKHFYLDVCEALN